MSTTIPENNPPNRTGASKSAIPPGSALNVSRPATTRWSTARAWLIDPRRIRRHLGEPGFQHRRLHPRQRAGRLEFAPQLPLVRLERLRWELRGWSVSTPCPECRQARREPGA